ncbi:hypothetical protein A8C32_11435 [Flavivirga aquatica]|uniref:Copper-binding protein MbnP-like domain-containing protein n=1 Tax=Flavivirga aquatica TaxID=1849968 RepID=A0A1E5TD99_9FLAO|nr:MbnP family protein [Flavivirga aquatica]OEK09329.1 hypothetical protein A8C32_11435 [Flavivirga aquatica]
MKRINFILITCLFTVISCNNDNDDQSERTNITLNFNHNWDETPFTNANFNTIQYTNANGEEMSITKLRYLISNVTLTKPNGETIVLDGYNLVDVTNNTDLSFTPITAIPLGVYSSLSFTFGFNNDANYNNNYTDLNSVSWNVPEALGGGYHYMQLEGKFIDNTSTETGYAYHTIRAVNNSGAIQVFQDTFFEVNLGEVTVSNNSTFDIEINIAEWFKNPNTWDLNTLNNMLMPNFDAQIMMFENGQNTFNLKPIQ